MPYMKTWRLGSTELVDNLLQGGIVGGAKITPQPAVVFGLHGLTLVFTTPAATVTFSDPTGAGLGLSAILAQIKAAVAALHPRFIDRQLVIREATPTNGVALNGAASTAASFFGFSDEVVTGKLYGTPEALTPPKLVWFDLESPTDFYVITEEP